MIQKEEIEAKAREFEIHISNVKRDYVFGVQIALRHRLTAIIRKYPSQNFVFLVYFGW